MSPRRGVGGRIFVCTDEPGPLRDPNPDCPNAAAHEPWPVGYLASMAYADQMLETHTQEAPCPGCERWLIWTPQEPTP